MARRNARKRLNDVKNPSKTTQNQSKINQERPQIDENTTMEHFQRQIAPRSPPKLLFAFGVVAFLRFLEILFGNMGPFSPPWEIADRSQIKLLRDNSDFDPRKMLSGRGFGKNIKNR